MRITIKYEASWRNSFLEGSNNEPLPKGGRKFIGSIKRLHEKDNQGKYLNFIKRNITYDTVMGILNRIIGDQRKLYQSRLSPDYFFADVESHITFKDQQDQRKPLSSETVYIRNMTGNTDQKLFTGMIKTNDPIFNSDYSSALWGVLTLDIEDLCKFIVDTSYEIDCSMKFDNDRVLQKLNELNKLKAVELETVQQALHILEQCFYNIAYGSNKGKIKPIELYCSALYLQVSRLGKKHRDISCALTKNGCIAGISKRGFTLKNFMDRYTTGKEKPIWGNPYQLKERIKGEGEVISVMTKASGTLEIYLNISREKGMQLKDMVEAAGVTSFYLGKKGLAYVDSIRL